MSDHLPTGIEVLDRQLNGGIPTGSLVALTAEPVSRAERLLYKLVPARKTLYLTTARTEDMVQDILSQSSIDVGQCEVRKIHSEYPLDHAYELLQQLSEQATVIIDPVNPLEKAGSKRLAEFLNTARIRMAETESVAILHCLEGRAVPPQRDITEYMVDGILSITTESQEETLRTKLTVPKFRGEPIVTEPIELTMNQNIAVDGAIA